MRISRRPAVATLALGLAALATVVSGCSYASPAVITTPYAASDGTNAELGAIKFRNFLIVSEAKGKPGVVVGALTTDGAEPVAVQLSVLGTAGGSPLAQATAMARPGQLTGIGSGGDAVRLQIENVPVLPGAVLTLHAQTPAGGTEFSLPVVLPTNEYTTLTPVPSSSPTSTPGASAVPPTASASPAAGSPSR